MNYFCPDCGEKHENIVKTPNFCVACGAPFTLTAAKAKLSAGTPNPRASKTVDNEEEVNNVPHIDGLKVVIEKPKLYGREPIQDIVGTSDAGFSKRAVQPKQDRKEFMRNFAKEGGSEGRKNS